MSEKPIRIMIVEDDEIAAKIYEQFTAKLDRFEVVATAATGKHALQLLNVFTPDLILLDVFLPDMNGIDLLREVRKSFRGIDVILITAANDVATVGEAIRGGAFGYMIKPILVDKFFATLDHYLQTRRHLEHNPVMNQTDVDLLFTSAHHHAASPKTAEATVQYPKGIDRHTLKLVREKMRATTHSVNADELASLIGMSHSTVRRYLEFLASIDELEVETVYGTVGRPERKYKCVHMKKEG
ncbi:response regulator [Brevibacillus fluminis]|uniref:response regulator n=1 Tax=Brevibacillus fluminis TaxID=511487 RepID=UPI003F8C03AC